MDIKQLECFVRVAELGSFTKAAATLRVSQPVLSRQVRQLEMELKSHPVASGVGRIRGRTYATR